MHPMMRKRKAYDDEEEELDDESGMDMGMGSEMEPELDDAGLDDFESEGEDTADPDLMSAAQAAFPDQEWDADRLAALKDFIHLCSNESYGEGEDSKGDDSGLALVFGSPKKK